MESFVTVQTYGGNKYPECYIADKAVVVPPTIERDTLLTVQKYFKSDISADILSRKVDIAYRGRPVSINKVRQRLVEVLNTQEGLSLSWKARETDTKLRVPQEDYFQEMMEARFCLCPTGLAPWYVFTIVRVVSSLHFFLSLF